MKPVNRFLIIGMGQFGSSVARNLAKLGAEVIALDRSEERIEEIAEHVAVARIADATDEAVLGELRVDTLTAAMCAIGDESIESSVLCTALLRQLGAPRLIARATNKLHRRILLAIGADEIVEPEEELGATIARKLARAGLMSQLALGDNMLVAELKAPEKWVDRTLSSLNLRKKLGISVIAVRRAGETEWMLPDPEMPFRRSDVLLTLGTHAATENLFRSFGA